MHVYMIECSANGKKYIGSSLHENPDSRLNRHRYDLIKKIHHNRYLQSCWDLYGPDAFSFKVIEIVNFDYSKSKNENATAIRRIEDQWIIKENTLLPNGFNCKTAELCVPTEESRLRMCEAQKKRAHEVSARHKGKVYSEETKRKLSEAQRGEKSYWYGKKQTDETRNKRSDSLKGRVITDEHREKLRQANLKQQKVECPHCGKRGNPSPMSLWHFERCKSLRSSE